MLSLGIAIAPDRVFGTHPSPTAPQEHAGGGMEWGRRYGAPEEIQAAIPKRAKREPCSRDNKVGSTLGALGGGDPLRGTWVLGGVLCGAERGRSQLLEADLFEDAEGQQPARFPISQRLEQGEGQRVVGSRGGVGQLRGNFHGSLFVIRLTMSPFGDDWRPLGSFVLPIPQNPVPLIPPGSDWRPICVETHRVHTKV